VQSSAAPSAQERSSTRIILTLTPDDAIALAGLIRSAADRRVGGQDRWIGTAEAARQLCVTQSTIRTWLARGLPRENPFPQPRQTLRRSRWQQTAIDEWRARQKEIDATKRGE
jgi:predicted DNA-binding transcriptional regulator AlpA